MTLPTTAFRGRIIADAFAPYLVPNYKVLDIGCGDGVVTELLRRRFDLEITGTDICNRLTTDIPFVALQPGAPLPFGDRSFDIALFNDVLHHLEYDQQLALVTEALRVARTLLIFEVEPGKLIASFDKAINFFHDKDMPVPMAFRKAEEWQHLLAATGRGLIVRRLERPAVWYPFNHVMIRLADAPSPPLQSAVGQLHS